MEQIVFEKDEKVKLLTLPDLKKTLSLGEFDGRLPTKRPVEHYQLIEDIQDILNQNNILNKLDPIIVTKADSKTLLRLQKDNPNCIESFLFRRSYDTNF